MTDFQAPIDDILFSLQHVAQASTTADWDLDITADILGHFGQFAEEVIAPLNAIGDEQGARLENGRVRMPTGFTEAYGQLIEGGWQGLTAPTKFDGLGLSPIAAAGVSEVFSGANHAMQMVCNLVPGAIATILSFGSEIQKNEWIPKLASGHTLSTMCLTEPNAGSDLSNIKCKARRSGDRWLISGEKIFISGGDQDMSENVLHLVLARSGTVEDGMRCLSLYLCAAQSAAKVLRLEEKLGLHASPTCHMVFDSAQADLIGAEGEGLKAMFTLMNHARIDVALQGVAHAARASHISATYADERRQGRQADGSPAFLSNHTDVRRMLDEQSALGIGARAMCHIALVELEKKERPALVEFLTPLCKIFATEAGIKSADLGIQVLGGYGYLKDYKIEQVWRDARITAIYEGANGIHERTIATRGLRRNGGADEFEDLIRELANGNQIVLCNLANWQDWRSEISEFDDPLPDAHAFAQATTSLFFKSCWSLIDQVAEQHPTRTDLSNLAQTVLKPKRR